MSGLKEVCEIQLNEPIWFSSEFLKVGRTLYVSTSRVTYAFDAATCDLRWRYVIDYKQVPANNNNRGPGYLERHRGWPGDRLDAKTGQVLWDALGAEDPTKHEAFNSAPIAWQGKVFIGISVGDSGIAAPLMCKSLNLI